METIVQHSYKLSAEPSFGAEVSPRLNLPDSITVFPIPYSLFPYVTMPRDSVALRRHQSLPPFSSCCLRNPRDKLAQHPPIPHTNVQEQQFACRFPVGRVYSWKARSHACRRPDRSGMLYLYNMRGASADSPWLVRARLTALIFVP